MRQGPLRADRDEQFLTAVRAALAARVAAIREELAEGGLDGLAELTHRELAARVKALIAASSPLFADVDADASPAGRPTLLSPLSLARGLAAALRERQGPGGLFTGGDNVDSPPDSAFSINDVADAVAVLRGLVRPADCSAADGADASAPRVELAAALLADLEAILAAATPALLAGGVHTPNHRWELSAALARLHALRPDEALVARVEEWLAEGVDIDADGLYSERSPNYAAHVSNPSLLAIARALGRDAGLVDAVEANLTTTLDLMLPDGSVETVMSRRQDQRWSVPLAHYLLPLREVAVLRGRGDLAWAAGLALEQGVADPATAATSLLLTPQVGGVLPAPRRPPSVRRRHLRSAGTLVDHADPVTTVVFGGSDHAAAGRIRSGLANSPTFLRLLAGQAVLDSVRLSRTFFGLGPFRSDGLDVQGDGGELAVLHEEVGAGYHQPLREGDRDPLGRYPVTDEGRFSGAMAFASRAHDRVSLRTDVRVQLTGAGAVVTVDIDGPRVDWALELAFRAGGALTGATRVGDHRWLLGAAPATYRVGEDAVTVGVAATTALGASTAPARYEPGEDYAFLGGTDAASGELLYLTGTAPAHVELHLTAGPAAGPLAEPAARRAAP